MSETITLKHRPTGHIDIYLKLPNSTYKKKRNIGELWNGKLYIFRREASHFYKESHGFGFCHKLLREYGHLFNEVVIVEGATVYSCERDYILDTGLYRTYNGLEKQVFISIEDFNKEKIEKWRQTRQRQSRKIEAKQMQCSLF